MPSVIIPNEAMLNWAQSQIDGTPLLAECYLRLCNAPVLIDSETTLTELNAAQTGYAGYSAVQLVGWSSPVVLDGVAFIEADAASFQSTEFAGGPMYCCYATNAAADKLLFACLFDEPVPISDEVPLEIVIQIDFGSIFN